MHSTLTGHRPASTPAAISPDARTAPREVECLAVTIPDAAKMLGVGRSTIYGLLGNGQIDGRKIGDRTVITTASIRSFLEGSPAASITAPKRAA